jgi:hypothetical protein
MDLGEYMTVAETAKKLKKSVPMITLLCRKGHFSGVVKLTTGAWLIPRAAVESYTPGKRGPRTKKERLSAELSGIREEMTNSKGESPHEEAPHLPRYQRYKPPRPAGRSGAYG